MADIHIQPVSECFNTYCGRLFKHLRNFYVAQVDVPSTCEPQHPRQGENQVKKLRDSVRAKVGREAGREGVDRDVGREEGVERRGEKVERGAGEG